VRVTAAVPGKGCSLLPIQLVAARLSLVLWAALAMVLAPSVGHLAIQERGWTARVIMLVILVALGVSVFALAAVRSRMPRRAVR
jgi:hypothetical protein